jgi:hypothetical protein
MVEEGKTPNGGRLPFDKDRREAAGKYDGVGWHIFRHYAEFGPCHGGATRANEQERNFLFGSIRHSPACFTGSSESQQPIVRAVRSSLRFDWGSLREPLSVRMSPRSPSDYAESNNTGYVQTARTAQLAHTLWMASKSSPAARFDALMSRRG